jgi:hypothetical protein
MRLAIASSISIPLKHLSLPIQVNHSRHLPWRRVCSGTALLLFCVTLGACSSGKTLDRDRYAGKLKDKLTTVIKGDGIKLFTYSAHLALPVKSGRIDTLEEEYELPRDASPNERRLAYERINAELDKWAEQIELGLEKTLKMTGFCREGYMELSRIIERGRGEIRGECNEGASEADKQKFAF